MSSTKWIIFNSVLAFVVFSSEASSSSSSSSSSYPVDTKRESLAPDVTDHSFYGLEAIQGRRSQMEDMHAKAIAKDHLFFGIYDGHNGERVADAISKKLYRNIIRNISAQPDLEIWSPEKKRGEICHLLEKAFHHTNKRLRKVGYDQGSTAVTALITRAGTAYIAWVGDSRAVLTKNDGTVSWFSQDHKPDIIGEYKRIYKAGGKVVRMGYHARGGGGWLPTQLDTTGSVPKVVLQEQDAVAQAAEPYRVLGRWTRAYGMSRAFGDKKATGIIATPSIKVHDIGVDDQALILASDGVWDVLRNEEAAQLVRESLSEHDDYQQAAQALVQQAFDRGSQDNISALVINLQRCKAQVSSVAAESSFVAPPDFVQNLTDTAKDESYFAEATKDRSSSSSSASSSTQATEEATACSSELDSNRRKCLQPTCLR